jgi:hypothetical protein
VQELRLSPLRQSESIELLRNRGLTEVQSARANGFAHGHPLALELAAAALLAEPDLQIELGPPPAVIRRLLDALVTGLPPRTIETLEAVAADLRERDPEQFALYRRRAWSYFEARTRTPTPERLWAVTANLIYLIRNPVLRAACFPEGSAEHSVEHAAATRARCSPPPSARAGST